MTEIADLQQRLSALVKGEIQSLSEILSIGHAELLMVAADLPPLVVTRSSLRNVLNDWRSGICSDEEVQSWASFVRRGYVAPGSAQPILPLDIRYDARDESLIVEIIGRFDELGDLIDGHVDDTEKQNMLAALQI